MTGMDGFEPARNQDAWATFRGFVYQVDLTLLRWGALEEDDYLELERGEDIDAVARAVSDTGDKEFVRTLEQVKVRERNLSLRSAEALTALANAYANLKTNEGRNLKFCYSTSAQLAGERPNPFPDGAAGIELWEQVRRQLLDGKQEERAVDAIRSFITHAVKPKKVPEKTWAPLVDLMSTAPRSDVADFIRRFEFSCGVEAPDSLSGKVKRQLGGLIAESDSSGLQVGELYNRLFLYVLKLLTCPGVKRLKRKLLFEQLAAPTLSSSDRTLLQRTTGRLELLEQRVARVEHTVESMSATVRSLAESIGGEFGHVRSTALASSGRPPLVEHLCPRADTVRDLLGSLDGACWLAIFGTTDTGKTHLVSLIASRHPKQEWFRFRHDMAAEQAFAVFRETAFRIAQEPSSDSGEIPYRAVCRRMKPDAVIVLDDLPRLLDDDPFTECLAGLARVCADEQVCLLSSSRFRMPTRLMSLVGAESIREVAVPKFSDSEAATLFRNQGAPDGVLSSADIAAINTLTGGHPFLLTHAGRYLNQHEWRFDEAEFGALLRGDHTTGLTDDLLARLCATLQQDQRDLLYRLSLATRSVSVGVVQELADVDPAIERSRECLANLNGAWLQSEVSHKYSVSPLVTQLLRDNLRRELKEQCHIVLGHGITRESMDPWDAHEAICHYRAGTAYDLAGLLFIELLNQSRLRTHVAAFRPILAIWSSESLPEQMHASLKLMVRAMQFWTYPKYSIPDAAVLAELDSHMASLSAELAAPAYLVASLAMLFLSPRDFTRSHQYFSSAIAEIRSSNVDVGDLVVPSKEHPVELLWTTIANIQSTADLETWKRTFASLTSDEQEIVKQSRDARLGSMVLADRLMLVESRRPEDQRQWPGVLDAFGHLYDWALDRDWVYLAACVVKSETNLCGEYLKEQRPNLDRVTDFVEDERHDESAKALVAGMYGKMLAGSGSDAEALPWLERAVAAIPVYEGHDRLMTLLAAAKCCRDDPAKAIEFTQQAVVLVSGNDSITSTEATRAYMEHAIAEMGKTHTQENALRCFPAWNAAAMSMFDCEERNDAWKELFVIFGHTHNFFFQLATTGEAPTTACDGSLYARPYQGFTATSHPERLELFHAESIPGIMWFQSLYARAAGDPECADEWLKRAGEELEGLPLTHVTAMVRQEMLPQMLKSDRFAEAFQAGIQGTLASVALKEYATQDGAPPAVPHQTPLTTLVDKLTDDGKRLAQRFTLITTAVPALLRVATIAVEDSDRAQDAARQLGSLCRQMSHGSFEPKYWDGAAEIYEAIADNEDTQAILELAHTFDADSWRELRVMGYLAVSVTGVLEAAYGSQLASIQVLMSWYPESSSTYAKVLLPFIELYWRESFRRQRFRFRSPSVVEPALREAQGAAPELRVHEILKAVRPAFRVRGLSDAEAWLNAEQ